MKSKLQLLTWSLVTIYLIYFASSLSAWEFTSIAGLIGIYALLAMSLNMICGMTGLLQLGHAGFFAIGAYSAALSSIYLTQPSWGFGNLFVSMAFAVIATLCCGVVIGLPCLRLRGDYLAIATLGFGEIVYQVFSNVEFPGGAMYPDETIGGSTGVGFTEYPDELWEQFPDYAADYASLPVIMATVAIFYILFRNLKSSAAGRAMMCIREDEIAAKAMGVMVPYYKMLAFLCSAAVAGIAGALFFHKELFIAPDDFKLMRSIEILLMVVLGGLGSFSGAILAAILLGILPEVLRRIDLSSLSFLPESIQSLQLSEYQIFIYALLLIALIRLAPEGLFGMSELPSWLKRTKRGIHE